MAQRQKRTSDEPVGERRSAARRLIAGLRISPAEEALLAVVRPYFTDLASEGELAYRLWRRGLELALAEVGSLGARLPPGTNEQFIAGLVAQRFLLCLPLLRRTGTLVLLGLEASSPTVVRTTADIPSTEHPFTETIDASASDAITGLGGSDFL
jgi:hypothetical protein